MASKAVRNKNQLLPDHILIGLMYFLLKDGKSSFTDNSRRLNDWFDSHLETFSMVDWKFRDRGMGRDSDSLDQSLTRLHMSKLIFGKTNDRNYYIAPEIKDAYLNHFSLVLNRFGISRPIMQELARDFAINLCL